MENTAAAKIICAKCHKFVEATNGEFFYVRGSEFFYCKPCAAPKGK
jgi:hypothetical protein